VKVWKENVAAMLEVTDNGSGIATEDLPHIFERFYTKNISRSREYGGTGLGLPIVKAICAAHRAKISVGTALPRGTRVRVEFPMERMPRVPARQVVSAPSDTEIKLGNPV
jgi:signal transduction histidine kinase